MSLPAINRAALSTVDRAEALGHFFKQAGEAPRVMAYDEDLGCPLHTALSAIEWTIAVGLLDDPIWSMLPGSRLRPQRFATSGGGILFAPARKGDPYGYEEVEANG